MESSKKIPTLQLMELNNMSLSVKVFNELKNVYLLCTLNDCNELASSSPRTNRNSYGSDKVTLRIRLKNYHLPMCMQQTLVPIYNTNEFYRSFAVIA